MQRRTLSFAEQKAAERERAKRKALKVLRRTRIAAEKTGVALSEWEGEFLESVEGRVKIYGRAFHDPEKGAPSASLSMLQHVKLKEIGAKASGKKKPRKNGFGRRAD
ncbi:MAG TPA: hypothetical protein VN932_04810 [Rhizomicrobium sp.]|nr:hypothetical protein [Rhizomicrobium sp.]